VSARQEIPKPQATSSIRQSTAFRIGLLLCLLYAFFLGLDLMGLSFKLFGHGLAETLMRATANPFVGLVVGVLATSLVQSSSTTTSMVVAMVGAGALNIHGAIPIIMGANIGTSVTNLLVSMGHITRREEFRRAFAGATIHDTFNLMTVAILLPVEILTGYLARSAKLLESGLEGIGGVKAFDPIKAIVRPVAELLSGWVGRSPILTLLLGVAALFLALKFLVDLLKVVFSSRAEGILHRTLFRSATAAILAGTVMTVMVQSSSITTSLMVPLVGAGVITLEQVFPFTLGANIGTTVTAIMASLATGSSAAVAVALSHLLFNVTGTVLIYPLRPIRAIPLAMARFLGDVGARNRMLAVAYVVAVFYGVPILMLFLSGVI